MIPVDDGAIARVALNRERVDIFEDCPKARLADGGLGQRTGGPAALVAQLAVTPDQAEDQRKQSKQHRPRSQGDCQRILLPEVAQGQAGRDIKRWQAQFAHQVVDRPVVTGDVEAVDAGGARDRSVMAHSEQCRGDLPREIFIGPGHRRERPFRVQPRRKQQWKTIDMLGIDDANPGEVELAFLLHGFEHTAADEGGISAVGKQLGDGQILGLSGFNNFGVTG